MQNKCHFKLISIIELFNLIYFSLGLPVKYIYYGESKSLYPIENASIFGLEIGSIQKNKNIKISIKLSNTTYFYKLNFKYKFFEENIIDTLPKYFNSIPYSDLKNEFNGTIIYTYLIDKDSDSYKYLLFNLGCNISEEVIISFNQENNSEYDFISIILGLIIVIFFMIFIISCCINFINHIKEHCCCCDDCCFSCYKNCCCFNICKKKIHLQDFDDNYEGLENEDDNMINIIIESLDRDIKNFKMYCKITENFRKIEQDLYKKYPKFKKTENDFC